ncbi:MAG: hypothetical protein ABR520_11150 [Mycobacteriales bacterium]|nr:hypothetical protein [Actinomycetota bacterium]
MNVLLWHLDGKLPNLALMRIAAHHRERGDRVELRRVSNGAALDVKAWREIEPRFGDPAWDRVYASAIFERTRPLVERFAKLYPTAELGGTGTWSLGRTLADVGVPVDGPLDYSSYPDFTASMGFTMRGCRFKCSHCVVPRKEGRARAHGTVAEIYRGAPWPPHLHLLDNDFFGVETWPDRIAEIRDGGFRVSFTQGINVRVSSDKVAAAIASVDFRADDMETRRIYTAWDALGDERVVFRGLDCLKAHGIKPDWIMVYMLIGHASGETHEHRDHRRRRLREYGCRPYPMPFVRTPELLGFQRWVVDAYDKGIPWERWKAARYNPRRLGDRFSLPLFGASS